MVLLRWKGRSLQKWPFYSHSTFNTVWFLTNCLEIWWPLSALSVGLPVLGCATCLVWKASYHNSWYSWERKKKPPFVNRRHSISDSNSKIKCCMILHCWIELKVRFVQSPSCGFLLFQLRFFVSVSGENCLTFSPNE